MDDTFKKKFVCNRCGCCCKNIKYYEPAQFLDRGDGVCKYYNDADKACTIYDFRPDFCRVDKMYKLYKDKMTWDEYVDLNYEECIELRKLEREKTENIGKDVSEVIDEDVSLTKIPKEEVTEYDPLDDDFFYDLDEDFFGDD